MSFSDYLQANSRFWETQTPQASAGADRAILVDLMTAHPGYFIGNALVAKYLQRILGRRVVAILRNRADEHLLEWAESFHLDDYVYLEDAPDIARTLVMPEEFHSPDPRERRRAFLKYAYRGVQLGDLAYDLYLRETGLGTLTDINQDLLSRLYQAINNFELFSGAIKTHNVSHTVQGHIVYATYGPLARAAINSGCTVFAKKFAAGPFTVRCYTDADSIKNHEYRFEAEEFEGYYRLFGERLSVAGEELMKRRISGQAVHGDQSNAESFGGHKITYSPERIRDQLQLDKGKPSVCIMSHVFADAPHCYQWMLYDDYYDWLVQTMEIVKDIKEVNWLVKTHPDNLHYNSQHSAREVCAAYTASHPHIKIVPDDLNTGSLFGLVNAIVTVCGTAGIEFTSMGVPCVNAGMSFYTGLGFTIDPKSETEYRSALENAGFQPALSPEQLKRARCFAQIYFKETRVRSCFIPDMPSTFWADFDKDSVFSRAREALETYTVEDDPVFSALSCQVEEGRPHIMNSLSAFSDEAARV